MSSPGVGLSPIVGRRSEIAEIIRTLDATRRSRAQILAVGGERGIGKTALATHASVLARSNGFRVLWSRLRDGDAVRPYEMWTNLFSEAFEGLATALPSRRNRFGNKRLEDIRWRIDGLVPGVLRRDPQGSRANERFDAGGGPPVPPVIHRQLFELCVSFLRTVAEESPVLVILDDVHLSDEQSLIALEMAAGEIGSAALVILMTFRTTRRTVLGGALARTFDALNRNASFVRLDLEPLDASEVRRVVEHSRIPCNDATLDAIYQRSEGNPLLVEELIALVRAGKNVLADREMSDSPS